MCAGVSLLGQSRNMLLYGRPVPIRMAIYSNDVQELHRLENKEGQRGWRGRSATEKFDEGAPGGGTSF